jgi:hypothetical protein
MTTLAAPPERRRRTHGLSCQHHEPGIKKACDQKATHVCKKALFYCSAHLHATGCCTQLGQQVGPV